MDTDSLRLQELGYEQQLKRQLGLIDAFALAFAGVSPVVGLYAVVLVGMTLAGPAWVWVLPVAAAGQCLLLRVYGELASEFPITGAAYQWSRRLVGRAYGWFAGWVAVWAYAVANTTVAYLGAAWALAVFGFEPTAGRLVLAGAALVAVCALAGWFGVGLLSRVVRVGIAAEVTASIGVGLLLLIAYREHGFSLLTHTLRAEDLSGGSVGAGLLAALAVGGWVFIGFDVGVGASEETHRPHERVPRAIWAALLSVAALVALNAVATTLAHPDPASVVAGADSDPVTTAVVSSFGSWSDRPFAAVVLIAFISCLIATQALTARTIYSIARDDALPASRFLRSVNSRGVPVGGTVVTVFVACMGLMLGLDGRAVGTLITFGTAAIYVSFLMTAVAALIGRTSRTWQPGGGRVGTVVNTVAVAWLAFETVNIAWPRASIAPPGAPFYQVWAAPLTLAAIGVLGTMYLVLAAPHRRTG